MPNVSLTGIEFTIKGSADKASASVDSLIQKLSNLNAALSNGANAQAFAKGLEGIAKAASSLNGMDISGAQSALSQLAQSMEPFKELGATAKNVAAFGNSMSKLAAKPENLMQVAEILAKIATIDFTNIKEAGEGLRNIAAAANSLAKIPKATKETGDAAKKANSPLKTFLKSLGRIAFYRIIRGILKSITQAFQEGLKNAYMFDKVAGGGLADALDNLATKSLTMKNQLGAAFGGLLTAITPVVIQIIKIVTALASAITRLIAILGGNSQWLKAKDVWTEWGDAAEGAGGAAKEALKYLAPFDELNVLPSQRSGGGGGGGDNYGDMFEWVDTDVGSGFLDSITEAFSKLADWFESKDWQDIGGKAWQTLKDIFTDGTAANEAVTSFMEALGSAFGALAGTAWGFLTGLVDDLVNQFGKNLTDYNGDGKLTAVDFLKAALKTGGDVVDWVYETLVEPFFDGFGRALTGDNGFDFTEWFVPHVYNPIIAIINNIIETINEKFDLELEPIPFKGVVDGVIVDIPDEEKEIAEMVGRVTRMEDALLPEAKNIYGVLADISGMDVSQLSFEQKAIRDCVAWILKTDDSYLKPAQKQLKGMLALLGQIDDSYLTEEQRAVKDCVASLFKTDFSSLTDNQRKMKAYAVVKTTDFASLPEGYRRMKTVGVVKDTDYNKLNARNRTFESYTDVTSTDFSSLTDTQKTVSGVTADSDKFTTSGIKAKDRVIGSFKVGFNKFSAKDIPAEKRSLSKFSAKMTKFDDSGINEKKRNLNDFNANLTGATNNIPKDQLSLVSTAEVTAKVIKSSLQDPYTHNLQLDATAHITSITGQTTVPILYNGIAGGMSASGGGVRYSIESGDNEEVLYRAMSRALADSELGGDIELDGEVLYKRMVNRNRANTRLTGVNAMA